MVIGTSLDPDMNDELRVTVVATGIGMDKRPEITLVTNKQVQQPVMDRYQQHGMAPLTQEQKPVAKVVNDNAPQTAKEPDYLDIPAFLRKQADKELTGIWVSRLFVLNWPAECIVHFGWIGNLAR